MCQESSVMLEHIKQRHGKYKNDLNKTSRGETYNIQNKKKILCMELTVDFTLKK